MSTTTINETIDGSNITFILTSLDLTSTIDVSATVDEGVANQNGLGGIVKLTCTIPYTQLRDIFRFQTDASSINDVDATDILYIQNFHANTDALLNAIVGATVEKVNDAVLPIATGNTQGQEYVQWIAYNVFGTRQGVDLFDNETDMINDLSSNMTTAFNTYFDNDEVTTLSSANTITGSKANVSKYILQTIMRRDPQRLVVGSGHPSVMSDTNQEQGIPIAENDVFIAKYEVTDNLIHANELGNSWDAAGATRSYIIEITAGGN